MCSIIQGSYKYMNFVNHLTAQNADSAMELLFNFRHNIIMPGNIYTTCLTVELSIKINPKMY